MRKTTKSPGEKIVKDIKRATRKQYSAEEKIRSVLDGLRGEDSIAECASVRAYHRASTTNGLRTSWKPVRSGWLAMRHGLRARTRSKHCVGRHKALQRLPAQSNAT